MFKGCTRLEKHGRFFPETVLHPSMGCVWFCNTLTEFHDSKGGTYEVRIMALFDFNLLLSHDKYGSYSIMTSILIMLATLALPLCLCDQKWGSGYNMAATHSRSPTLTVKPFKTFNFAINTDFHIQRENLGVSPFNRITGNSYDAIMAETLHGHIP